MTTAQVMETLGVSRAWVNTHLRKLGSAPMTVNERGLRTVLYDDAAVLRWLNENAKFYRQTEWVRLADYAPKRTEEIEAAYDMIERMPSGSVIEQALVDEAFGALLSTVLSDDQMKAHSLVNNRARGQIPWVEVTARVGSFDELHSVEELCGGRSPELAYRTIYYNGMIKMEVAGRRWFLRAGERPDHAILMPYGSSPK